MHMNEKRAGWAEHALQEFSDQCGPPLKDTEDAIDCMSDLIGDLLHYAEKRGIDDPEMIVRRGVGMWSAERRHPDGEPPANDHVTIEIQHAWEPE